MKILHLCLGCFYPDGYTYQENLLPKFHKNQGHEVEVIASTQSFDKNGKVCFLEKYGSYYNEYGIKVTRLEYKKPHKLYRKLKKYIGTYDAVKAASPDIIFIHGCQFLDIDCIFKYKKEHMSVKIYIDNHADFSNSATNFFSKSILHGIIWKGCARKIEPVTERFYGVLPARVDFLVNVYGIPKEKVEFLPMGGDNEYVEKASQPLVRKNIRDKYNIKDDDFLIVTGGKIDLHKTQTLLLMEAINMSDNPKIKLIVFGSVVNELKEKVNSLCSEKVQYIGWVKSLDTYDYFGACDLAVFPGRHSVIWEQVAAQGVPMIVKHWNGTDHVNINGNVVFLYNDSVQEISQRINDVISSYPQIKKKAQECADMFLYSEISRKSIDEKIERAEV